MHNTKRILAFVTVLLLAPPAFAQSNSPFLYVWSDPGSATKRYSNLPPEWYRNPLQAAEGAKTIGPRVKVYYGAALVDDTALSPDARKALVPPAPPPKGQQRPR